MHSFSDLIQTHDLKYHLCADDSQIDMCILDLSLTFRPICPPHPQHLYSCGHLRLITPKNDSSQIVPSKTSTYFVFSISRNGKTSLPVVQAKNLSSFLPLTFDI